MELAPLKAFAEQKLVEFGLHERGWTFHFDRARVRFGACKYATRRITLSRALAAVNSEEECKDTILHEIAHAIAGRKAGHGRVWKQVCLRIGARPERCYTGKEVNHAPPTYWGECASCGTRFPLYRLPRRKLSCAACGKAAGKRSFDERFVLRLVNAKVETDVGWGHVQVQPAALYQATCARCGTVYHFKRIRRKPVACGACCKNYAEGRFDARFRLVLRKTR